MGLGFVLEDVGDLGLFEVLALGLRVSEVVVAGEVAVAVDVGLALALDRIRTRVLVVGVVVLGLAFGRSPYFDFRLGLLLVGSEVRSDSVLLKMRVVGEIEMPGWRSGHFFFNLALTVVVAVLEVQAIGLVVLPLFLLHGRSDGIIGIVLLVLDGNGEGIRFDLVIDLIGHYVHLIEDCLEVALRLMLAVLAA